MKITIKEKLRPFFHLPGSSCPLPGSTLIVQCFPTLIRVKDLANSTTIQEIPLKLTGPVKDWTMQLDLEKGCIWIWGHYQEGYRRFCLWYADQQFQIVSVREGKEEHSIKVPSIPQFDRLSLGSHKKQDWELVKRRLDFKEIFPHWLKLGQLVPTKEKLEDFALFDSCKEAIQTNDKLKIVPAFQALFQTFFEGILVPRLEDCFHLGTVSPLLVTPLTSPVPLLTEGARLIRSLFIDPSSAIRILPCLPPQFHAGRFVNIDLGERGSCDLEWSKKLIRRIVWRSRSSQDLKLQFQKGVHTYRLRKGTKDKGIKKKVEMPLTLEADSTYFFDNFE